MSANQWPYVSRADAEKEIAHAVALERAAIVDWLNALADDENRHALTEKNQRMRQAGYDEASALRWAASCIAQGAHNPQTPTSGSGAAQESTYPQFGSTDTSNDAPSPQTAETGIDSCRPSPESEDA